ncbi:YcxB family protein [Lacrimispora xylanisolvens]|uniref:YcxB family protein n=1 Tax=Lacrimispora xylanisolvens TaxID=384636 RepID=UPI0014741829
MIISISNINIKIPYSDFVKIIETKNLYLMKTKAAKEGNPVIIKKTHYLMCQKRT